MKILYACLGAGNGHVSRARDIIPYVQAFGDVDVAVSGTDSEVQLPVSIGHQHHGLIFHLGAKGGLDYWRTAKDLKVGTVLRDISEFPMEEYDVLINDFEPITARSARRARIPSISLSHQASFASRNTPRTSRHDPLAEFILRNYAPCDVNIGFHFAHYDSFIKEPVVRKEVRDLVPRNDGHYTIYLPAYDDQVIIKVLGRIPGVKWQIFSKRSKTTYVENDFTVLPVSSDGFLKSFETCEGLITGGGFESPAEALFLGKKVMMVPQKRQYEQECNAEAARRLGVPVLQSVDLSSLKTIERWIAHEKAIQIDYPDHSAETVGQAMEILRTLKQMVYSFPKEIPS